MSESRGLSRSPSDDSAAAAEVARRSARQTPRPRPTTEEDAPRRRTGEEGRSRWRMSRNRLLAAGRSPGRRPPGGAGDDSDEELNEQASHRVRMLARRALVLCQRSDWVAVDQSLKSLERAALEGRLGPCPFQSVVDEREFTPLMYAARDNRPGVIDKMVELGCDINHVNQEGLTVLHMAVLNGREDMVKALLNKKADINARSEPKQMTCVHLACTRTSAVGVLRLLLHQIRADTARLAEDADGNIPLFLATEVGALHVCKELLSTNAEQQVACRRRNGDTMLHMAVRRRDLELAKLFADHGTEVDAQNAEGQTALHVASSEGDEGMVKFLHSLEADAAILDCHDRTALHVAAEHGYTLVVEALADKFKASVMDRTKDGDTLLHIASRSGHPGAVVAAIKNGLPLRMPNKAGLRAIHQAALAGHGPVIAALIQSGELVDTTSRDGLTPLHLATRTGQTSAVETLLGHGAQMELRGGSRDETPLHLAASCDDATECVQALLKSGASVHSTDNRGLQPLHVAARRGHLETCQLLLEEGADSAAQCQSGNTPLHLACSASHRDVITALLRHAADSAGGEARLERLLSAENVSGLTPVHCAAGRRQLTGGESETGDILALLCVSGARLDRVTSLNHETPFHCVARYGNDQLLEQMLTILKDQVTVMAPVLNLQTATGETCLMVAAREGHQQIVKTLMDNGARLDVLDSCGRTALHLSAAAGHGAVCETLLGRPALLNARCAAGCTALHLAAAEGFSSLVESLLQRHGAAADIAAQDGLTPLHLSAGAGHLEVCSALVQAGSDTSARDAGGQTPVLLAARHNHAEVVKLLLKYSPELPDSADQDGNTCAHVAATHGSVDVVRELLMANATMVTSSRNRKDGATPLHLAAETGNTEMVRVLLDAGANADDEDKLGFTCVHLAAYRGQSAVLAQLRALHVSMQSSSRRTGLSALHIAAYYGQIDMVWELLQYVPATLLSSEPAVEEGVAVPLLLPPVLAAETQLTPLHLASLAGHEDTVRLLLNSSGAAPVDPVTTPTGYTPLQLACVGSHVSVVTLLLSWCPGQLAAVDGHGRTPLHLSAAHGHTELTELLLWQGAEPAATDTDGLTALHRAAQRGHLPTVQLLLEDTTPPDAEEERDLTDGLVRLAVVGGHTDVTTYLVKRGGFSHGLLTDQKFLRDLTLVSASNQHHLLEDFVLSSPAPVYTAAKLAAVLRDDLSTQPDEAEEVSRHLRDAAVLCQTMTSELLALASCHSSTGTLLAAVDPQQTELFDLLIQLRHKEVIAHPVVQSHLSDVWHGGRSAWPRWRAAGLLAALLLCPPLWALLSLPVGPRCGRVPLVRLAARLASHAQLLLLLLMLTAGRSRPLLAGPLELALLLWLAGLLLAELTAGRQAGGLRPLRLAQLGLAAAALVVHGAALTAMAAERDRQEALYIRNQILAFVLLLGCVQLLDFLSFHHMFGPWAITLRAVIADFGRFLLLLLLVVCGFSLQVTTIFTPVRPMPVVSRLDGMGYPPRDLPDRSPLNTLEMMLFSLLGLAASYSQLPPPATHPAWSAALLKLVMALYLLLTAVVLTGLLVAMMTDTCRRSQAESQTEWKFELAQLIHGLSRSRAPPAPLNLVTKLIVTLHACVRFKGRLWEPAARHQLSTERLTERRRHLGRPAVSATSAAAWTGRLRRSAADSSAGRDRATLLVQPSVTAASSASGGCRRLEDVVNWSQVADLYLLRRGRTAARRRSPGLADTDEQPRPTESGSR